MQTLLVDSIAVFGNYQVAFVAWTPFIYKSTIYNNISPYICL